MSKKEQKKEKQTPATAICPVCNVERADYEGEPDKYLDKCPNCGTTKSPATASDCLCPDAAGDHYSCQCPIHGSDVHRTLATASEHWPHKPQTDAERESDRRHLKQLLRTPEVGSQSCTDSASTGALEELTGIAIQIENEFPETSQRLKAIIQELAATPSGGKGTDWTVETQPGYVILNRHDGTVPVSFPIGSYHQTIRDLADAHNATLQPQDDTKQLLEVLKKASQDLTCRQNGTHYCPNCDNSLFDVKTYIDEAIDAAMRKEK